MSPKTPIVLALFLLSATVQAQPLPTIQSVTPDVVLPGVSTEITVTGENLANAIQIVLPQEQIGLTASAVAVPTTGPSLGKQVKFRLDAKADARRGQHDLRIATPLGVSRAFSIGIDDLPLILQKPGNNSAKTAQEVALPAIISGKVNGALDANYYRFHAAKNDRLMFDVFAQRIGSKLDSSLAIQSADGKLLAHDEDTNGLDSLIDFTAPADGDYFLRIQDLKYQGGGDYQYRIRAGAIPFLDAIYPMGGKRGQDVSVAFIGRNLQGADKLQMHLEAAGPVGVRNIAASTSHGLSNARAFEVGDLAEYMEQEPNDAAAQPNEVKMPVTINGQINKPGDVDSFKFKPTTQPIICEVLAQRANSPLDALITLTNAQGQIVQRNNGDAGADARLEANGLDLNQEYTISITDLLGRGGDSFVYRLSVKPAAAAEDFQVVFQGDVPRVARGSAAKLWCNIVRTGGFKGEVSVTLNGLPKGLHADPVVFKEKELPSGVMAIFADADAATGFYPLTFTATAQLNGQPVTRTFNFPSENAGQVLLTVLDTAPFYVQQLGPASQENDPKKREEKIAGLKKLIDTPTPALDAVQVAWEKKQAAAAWRPIEIVSAKGKETQLKAQADGTIKAEGATPAKDTYTIVANTAVKKIRAIKLEAIAADGGSPGRADDGNFVLTNIHLLAAPTADPSKPTKVELQNPRADFSQDGYNVKESLVEGTRAGWAVSPRTKESHWAVWEIKAPISNDAGTQLTFELIHNFDSGKFELNRFRLMVSDAEKPEDGFSLPGHIPTILATAAEQRDDKQKAELAAYYRTVSPELKAAREQLAELTESTVFPPVVKQKEGTSLIVQVARNGFEGDITLNIEGFSAGMENNGPVPIAKSFEVKPIILKGKETRAVFPLKTNDKTDKATRAIIVKMDATVNGQPRTEYSKAIPMTVK